MSPFLRMIRNENRAEIYDNPSIAAIIDFKWNAARSYFLRQIFLYFMFALPYSYKRHDPFNHDSDYLIKICQYTYYWMGFYLLNIERNRIKYNGWKRYHNFYNLFDLFSVVFPLFSSLVHNILFIAVHKRESSIHDSLIICKSFSILIISMEILLLLRYFEKAGAYVYIITNIFKNIAPFLIFMLLFVFGFSYSMYILLEHTDANRPQNYSDLLRTTESVFFWTNGRWDQLDQWGVWQKEVFSLIGSVVVATILQNMLIAIMTSAFDDAKEVSRHATLKYRADVIAEYEAIDKPFGNQNVNPRFIYFTGKTEYIEKWLEKSRRTRENYRNFLAEIDNDHSWHYDDDDDDDDYDDNDNRRNWFHSHDTLPNARIPLSLCWFVDEDVKTFQSSIKTSSIIQVDNIQKENIYNEVKILQDKIHHLLNILQN
ncbi:hypothetical protein RclHR1_02880018 [Rhizophagus clarus]|nr:hypothetical protein RclHR1_02880018 [Rhizophagus clarus]